MVQRKRAQQLQVGTGLNVQRVVPRIGEQPRPETKKGTVVKIFAPAQDGDVVQVTVLVAGQHIRFKEQGQILAKTCKAGKLRGLLGYLAYPFGKIWLADIPHPLSKGTLENAYVRLDNI